ncbi:hypothetical protein DBV15_06797 [Temnothorax longispinosus]|uniref:Uncharacterized protein n=1 Tax=Temnothorax longispinosus TaxID=300112 RepID=A0A4S2KH09_9HYME|nr:hypothetical protein DBV15_06797 [Temnothorax longispinosus]
MGDRYNTRSSAPRRLPAGHHGPTGSSSGSCRHLRRNPSIIVLIPGVPCKVSRDHERRYRRFSLVNVVSECVDGDATSVKDHGEEEGVWEASGNGGTTRQTRNSEEPGSSLPDHRNFYIPNCTPRTSGARAEKTGLPFGGDIKFEIGRQAWGAWEF